MQGTASHYRIRRYHRFSSGYDISLPSEVSSHSRPMIAATHFQKRTLLAMSIEMSKVIELIFEEQDEMSYLALIVARQLEYYL